MALAQQLNATTVLTPRQREHDKTRQEKAQDVIYTLNHALTCLSVTDLIIMPVINAGVQAIWGEKAPRIGCGHAGHEHHHSLWEQLGAPFRNAKRFFTDDASWKEKFSALGKNSKNWLISEAVGDIGAVVPTVAMQRFAPGVMAGIRHALEPVVGGWFRRGSEKAARQWADKQGIAHDAQAVVDRAKELYEYEVSHLPQMAVWTLSSILINWGVMKKLNPEMGLGEFARTKTLGAGITAGLVMGARAFSPNAAHAWDGTMSKHVIAPATKILGKPFGVRDEDVDKFARDREGGGTPVPVTQGKGVHAGALQALSELQTPAH